MKKYMVTVALVLLIAAGCGNKMSTWVMTGQDTDVKARLGYVVADGVQVGCVATWTPAGDIEWGPEPTGIGAFALVEAWTVQTSIEKAPPPVDWLNQLKAVPYAGLELLDDNDNDNFGNLQPQWFVGSKFLLDPAGKVAINVEYSDGDLPSDTFVGLTVLY